MHRPWNAPGAGQAWDLLGSGRGVPPWRCATSTSTSTPQHSHLDDAERVSLPASVCMQPASAADGVPDCGCERDMARAMLLMPGAAGQGGGFSLEWDWCVWAQHPSVCWWGRLVGAWHPDSLILRCWGVQMGAVAMQAGISCVCAGASAGVPRRA
jgi:hypothetical protein